MCRLRGTAPDSCRVRVEISGGHIRAFVETLRFREYRLFWLASAISLTGDQLTFIALPWLVLKLTGDPLVMGTVLAVAAVPRAVLMLIGGVVTDTYSPRLVMFVSNAVRMALVLVLAITTFTGTIDIWMVYAVAFLFGVADAFMFPAASAFPPRLLPPERLAAGNSLFQGTAQVTLVLGPLFAGVLIASFASTEGTGVQDAAGLSLVFGLDAFSFVVPLVILLLIRDRYPPEASAPANVWTALMEGLRHTWNDLPLRTFILLLGALSLVFRGPFMVGIPVFADAYLPEGAAAFGSIISALGVGSIVGTLIAGMTPHPDPRRLGMILLADFLGFGAVLMFMTAVPATVPIAGAVLLAAVVDGYVIVVLTTWTQKRVPREKIGRVMSVVMVSSQGLFPVSAAAAGALAGWNLSALLLGTGIVMLAITVVGVCLPTVRRLGHS